MRHAIQQAQALIIAAANFEAEETLDIRTQLVHSKTHQELSSPWDALRVYEVPVAAGLVLEQALPDLPPVAVGHARQPV